MILVGVLIALVQLVVAFGLAYYYVLLATGGRPRRSAASGAKAQSFLRLAVAVPAHNEESVIDATVTRLCQMDYPAEWFDVHVVADHCSDSTAEAARSAGATVHERFQAPRGRKAFALQWLLARLLGDPRDYDAIVVFDADSQVDPAFLRLMNIALAGGARVVQGHHVIANPEASVFSALADGDMRLNNRMRNQAKENLGLSARLMGDGMCFHRETLEQHPFETRSLTEDREYGIHLVACGERVRYVPEAISAGQAVARWRDATSQRMRWYGGVFALPRQHLRPLLSLAWRERNWAALDLALELSVPSFSTLSLLAMGLVILQGLLLLLGAPSPLLVSGFSAAAAFLLPLLGLAAERAPRTSFQALVFAPAYAAWRVSMGLAVRLRRGRVNWVRTRRAEEQAGSE
ncbi:MAG: glycosyltransferase [Anaerolineae bacterium]|nr:glycosyltransferase [Anaerolineae bacterium]